MMPQFMSASSDGSRLIKSPQAAKKEQPIEKDKNFGKKYFLHRFFSFPT
jgi:hypothetical protein